eukprot:8954854-Pyramimonas_sp.AAC.1
MIGGPCHQKLAIGPETGDSAREAVSRLSLDKRTHGGGTCTTIRVRHSAQTVLLAPRLQLQQRLPPETSSQIGQDPRSRLRLPR